MKQFLNLSVFLASLLACTLSYADRQGTNEAIFILPFVQSQSIDFEGGAKADINSDPGLGFGFAYNYTSKINARMDFTWNDINYDATRVLDDNNATTQRFSGELSIFSFLLSGEYYFRPKGVTPFLSGGIGWNHVDTHIPSGPPSSVCWWDPFWGYICDGYQPTYGEREFSANLGAGLRVPVGRSHFVKLGYYSATMDYGSSSSSHNTETIRFELGTKLNTF